MDSEKLGNSVLKSIPHEVENSIIILASARTLCPCVLCVVLVSTICGWFPEKKVKIRFIILEPEVLIQMRNK